MIKRGIYGNPVFYTLEVGSLRRGIPCKRPLDAIARNDERSSLKKVSRDIVYAPLATRSLYIPTLRCREISLRI
jgi:hypothetical protein